MGGCKSKKGARSRQEDSATQKATRYSKEEGEIYACVTRLFGGPHCEVKCIDGKLRCCIIRNKFRGRGKRDNTLISGTWVLVGLRNWETPSDGKLPKCDLLEVYTASDKQRLKNTVKNVEWAQLNGIGQDIDVISDEDIDFVDQETIRYEDHIKNGNSVISFLSHSSDEDNVDIDSV